MPFCPNCRTEYVGDASRCADCGTELVARLPHRDSSPDLSATRPELLCDVDSLVQADLIESQLRAAGIPVVRRPRGLGLFVSASRAEEARLVMAGQSRSTAPRPETLGLSELSRIRLVCSSCDKATTVDLLEESVPAACSCGHYFDLSAVRPALDRYRDLMRTLDSADFEIEIELPEAEE